MRKSVYTISLEEDTYRFNNHTVSNEMIAPQVNDYIVPALEEQYGFIISSVKGVLKSGGTLDAEKVYKLDGVKEALDKIDKLLYERFGLRTKHLCTSACGIAACLPIQPKGHAALRQDNTINTHDEFENEANTLKEGLKDDGSEIYTLDDERWIIKYDNAVKSISKSLNAKGVHFDLNKAKITGLDKDFVVYVLNDYTDTYTYDITPKEFVAIQLHEIGHLWTHLEYSYRATHNTSILVDTFIDNYRNKNKTLKESLLISFREVGVTEVNNLKDKNTVTVAVAGFTAMFKRNMGPHEHSYTDSEALADVFSGRFGLGGELSSGLAKLHNTHRRVMFSTFFGSVIILTLCLTALKVLGCLAGPVTVVMIPVILFWISVLFFKEEKALEQMTYDDQVRRFKRIINEQIRILRSVDLPKDAIKQILADIERVESIIDNVNKQFRVTSSVEAVARMLFKGKVEMKRLEQLTEDLMENKLHVASAKLKLLNK